jgi:aminopeptidase-like protein
LALPFALGCGSTRTGEKVYRAYGEQLANPQLQQAVLWVLNQSDGWHGLLDVAERSEIPFDVINEAAALLEQHELIVPVEFTLNSASNDSDNVRTRKTVLN